MWFYTKIHSITNLAKNRTIDVNYLQVYLYDRMYVI